MRRATPKFFPDGLTHCIGAVRDHRERVHMATTVMCKLERVITGSEIPMAPCLTDHSAAVEESECNAEKSLFQR